MAGWRRTELAGTGKADVDTNSVVPAPKAKLEKVTLYVRPDQVIKIEEIQLSERQRTGKRPDKSDLIQEALDLLIQKYSNTSSRS